MPWWDPDTNLDAVAGVLVDHTWGDKVKDDLRWLYNWPTAMAFNSAAISVASGGSGQILTMNSESWDNDGIHSTSTLTGRLTCVTAGVYDIVAYLYYAGNATGTKRNLAIRVNGATFPLGCEVNGNPDGANPIGVELTFPYKLAVNDFVELRAFHDAGVALNVTPRFGMSWRSAG